MPAHKLSQHRRDVLSYSLHSIVQTTQLSPTPLPYWHELLRSCLVQRKKPVSFLSFVSTKHTAFSTKPIFFIEELTCFHTMTTFNTKFFTFVVTLLLACTSQSAAFAPASTKVNNFSQRQTAAPGLSMAATATPTLTDETTWKLRFVMRGLPTSKGRKVDEIFNIHGTL